MKKSILTITVVCAALAGCQTTPPPQEARFIRTDGREVVGNPVLEQQGHIDLTICQGEAAKLAGVQSPVFYPGLAGAMIAAEVNRQHNDAVSSVLVGCMAERGYATVPADQAAATLARFRKHPMKK